MNHIIQNHMVQGSAPAEFREPKPSEMADAQDCIVESYIAGEDKYDLNAYLAECVLESLWARAKRNRVVPHGEFWSDIVYNAAMAMAAKWSPSEWETFRARRIF